MFDLDVKLHDDGSWLCQHIDASESPAPPHRLSLEQAIWEVSMSNPRRGLRCADCGMW
jgi:hypothetical protein